MNMAISRPPAFSLDIAGTLVTESIARLQSAGLPFDDTLRLLQSIESERCFACAPSLGLSLPARHSCQITSSSTVITEMMR